MPPRANWNNLSDPLKHKCIGKMDFVTKIMLRSTCRKEQRLVDRHKTGFELMRIEEANRFPIGGLTLILKGESKFRDSIHLECENWDYSQETMVPLVKYVLKIAKIDALAVNISNTEILREIAKIVYDIKTPPNWSSLSEELKIRIIENMDFPTRLRFRQTARDEKLLTDDLKVRFQNVQLVGRVMRGEELGVELCFQWDKRIKTLKFATPSKYHQKALSILAHILKIGQIDIFYTHHADDLFDELIEILYRRMTENLQIRHLDGLLSRSALFSLAKILDSEFLEHFEIWIGDFEEFPSRNLLSFPVIQNLKKFEIHDAYQIQILCAIIEKWIEIDVAIGTTTVVHRPGEFYKLLELFENRIVFESSDGLEIQISTNNPAKQIHIHHIDEENFLDYCTCEMIGI